LTVAVIAALSAFATLWQKNEQEFAIGASLLAILAAMLSPFASSFPDGLEWVAEKLSFVEFGGFEVPVIFPDYQAVFIGHEGMATVFAGIVGVILVFCITFVFGRSINRYKTKIA